MVQQTTLEGMDKLTKREPAITSMSLLDKCLANGGAIEVVKELAALRRDEMAREAELAFNEAMNAAQSELERVAPDLVNKGAGNGKYASYAAMDRAIRPVYTKHGFSLSFDTKPMETTEVVHVVCYVSHREGHTRTYNAILPADGKGAKGGEVMSKTWATGAAMSYGMRYLLKMIFNLAIGEDEDALSNGWLANELKAMENAKSLDGLKQIYFAAYNQAKEEKNGKAMLILAEANDKYRAKLQ